MNESRPNPDQILEQIKEEESIKIRGKLKVYLGMAAGVGKTYSMLSDAIIEKSRGLDVVAGYIEPHGRVEVQRLAAKLPSISLRRGEYRGIQVNEFDLDRCLELAPSLVLVDELAHTNVPGSRHEKRWQDIEEVLDHGINVWTTVNIQHIESLTDIVKQITGIDVQETVPDAFFRGAEEVELVDTPPEDLIQRIRDGKVYLPDKVDHALSHFFKKGNLIALRELALRQTASQVEAEMDSFRSRHKIREFWPAADKILVCVAPNRLAEKIVRTATRIATTMHAQMVVAYIETLRYSLLPAEQRRLAFQALELGEQLGAETVYRQSADIAGELLSIAAERNITIIVMGKPMRRRWKELVYGSVVDEVLRRSGKLHIYCVPGFSSEGVKLVSMARFQGISFKGIFLAVGVFLITTSLCYLFDRVHFWEFSDISMVYLAAIAYISVKSTFWETLIAATLSVLACDFLFVPPRYTFAVANGQYFITFSIMLLISIFISRLTSRLRLQAKAISERERRTAALFDLTRHLTSAMTLQGIKAICSREFEILFGAKIQLLMPNERGVLVDVENEQVDPNEQGVALWAYEHNREAGLSTDTLPGAKCLCLPLVSRGACVGVLGIRLENQVLDLDQKRLMEAFSNQLAVAADRVRAEEEGNRTRFQVEREKLRSSLLSSLSHDLRTPLAAISGAASALLQSEEPSIAARKELSLTISEESDRLSRMVRNILDITKLESGEVQLQKEWHSLEELVSTSLERSRVVLGQRQVKVDIPFGFPLIQVDGILMEQLFTNLFENVGRHTPPETKVTVSSDLFEPWVEIVIADNGPGIPPNAQEKVFQKNFAGSRSGGFGLGLYIARAIVVAHGGQIVADNNKNGGAVFCVKLPYVCPPSVENPND